MQCIHCQDEFWHHPTQFYFCCDECWNEESRGVWRILPDGPAPLIDRVRLGVKRGYGRRQRRYRTKITEAERLSVIERLLRGESHHHIAKIVGVARGTVYNIRQREMLA